MPSNHSLLMVQTGSEEIYTVCNREMIAGGLWWEAGGIAMWPYVSERYLHCLAILGYLMLLRLNIVRDSKNTNDPISLHGGAQLGHLHLALLDAKDRPTAEIEWRFLLWYAYRFAIQMTPLSAYCFLGTRLTRLTLPPCDLGHSHHLECPLRLRRDYTNDGGVGPPA